MPTLSGTPAASYTANSTTPTLAFTMPATGDRRAVTALVCVYDFNGGFGINSVTYGGNAMTQVVTIGDIAGSGIASWYILPNPPTGANNLVVNMGGNVDECILNVCGWVDVNQSGATSNAQSNTGSTTSTTALTASLSANDVLVGGIYEFYLGTRTLTPSDTGIVEVESAAGISSAGSQYSTDGTCNWTLTNTDGWSQVGFRLIHDAGGGGGGGGSTLRMGLLGVGR